MRYSIRTVTPVADIPLCVEVGALLRHLRVDEGDAGETALAEAAARAAMDAVERHCSQVLSAREMEISFDGFPVLPELIAIPRAPVTGILSITYVSAADGSDVVIAAEDGAWRWSDVAADQVKPAWGAGWPVAAREQGSVRLRFEAGYGEGLVPPALAQAVLMTAAWLYEQRGGETDLPEGAMRLCGPFRRMVI